MIRRPPRSTLFPYTTSSDLVTPTAVGSSQTLRQEDSVADAERLVDDDEDASDDILHRVLSSEGDSQTEDTECCDKPGDIDAQLVGGSQ